MFAPDDAAFAKLPPSLLTAYKTIVSESLIDMLLYHVHQGILIDPVLTDNAQFLTMDNKTILINRYPNSVSVIILLSRQ